MTAIYIAGKRLNLAPDMLIGTGGEAEVFDLGDGRALKLFKTPKHPDLAGADAEQKAARERLDIHQSKLREFPDDLPERVIAPRVLATSRKRGGRIVGYAMELIPRAELLYRYGEPRFRRRSISGDRVADALSDLRDTVAAIHDCGVVIGDFNDLNVLVGAGRAYVIDSDSFQFGSYLCSVYSERFVDPLLCDPNAGGLLLKEPHRPSSDWYAFAVMAMRSLLCVGPYGGVYRPADKSRRVPHGARPLHRITVFDPEVVYPKPALHYRLLPDELLAYFHSAFVEDRREPFPTTLLDDLRWTQCRSCGAEHARAACPSCHGKRGKKPAFSRVRGRVTAEEVFATEGIIVDVAPSPEGLSWLYRERGQLRNRYGHALGGSASAAPAFVACLGDGALFIDNGRASVEYPTESERAVATRRGARAVRVIDSFAGAASSVACFATNQRDLFWLAGGRLWRDGDLGDVAVGEVLRGQTRIWVGERFGFGFYRAGALTVGFVFDTSHPGIDDSIVLPRIRGQVIETDCALADTRAWFSWTEARAGRELRRCALIARDGRSSAVIATAGTSGNPGDDDWLASMAGACAVGHYLFVPTDRGIQRVEAAGDRLRITRSFPDTEPFVDAAARLVVGKGGLHAASRNRILRLQLS